tara:strand:- start:110 stop:712 length:603 start_codon:yes stop_codon:yes gene_type:complete
LKYLIYLHGFNSSPQSEKARLTKEFFCFHSKAAEQTMTVIVPSLPPSPSAAISLVHELIKQQGRENLIGFIGSSLGGFYSMYLQRYYSQEGHIPKAILINPAIRPYELLTQYLGENQNMYTGETYVVESSHMNELKSLIVEPIRQPNHTMLLTQTDDEVLAYQDGVTYLSGVKMWVQFGGSHAFDDYALVLPSMLAFCLK